MELPAEDGARLLVFALGKEQDERLFMRWIVHAQYEVSFDDFKKSLLPVRIDEKATMAKLDDIMENTTWQKMPIQG